MTAITLNLAGVTLKGKGAVARLTAFNCIAADAMVEGTTRLQLIATVSAALGKAPTDGDKAKAKAEYVIGRIAARLPLASFPKGADVHAKLTRARELVLHCAAPAVEGKATRPLRKGQTGRRSVLEHKAIRAAEEAWSQVLADCGIGKAQTSTERNAAKRAPAMKGTTARGKSGDAPKHSELVTPAKPLTADDAVQHVMLQGASLLQFANKNAKLLPTSFGAAVQAFKVALNKAANEHELTKAK